MRSGSRDRDNNETMIDLERRDDGVAVVTLSNGKVNALSRALLAELHEAAIDLTENPPGAVVVTGGERVFAAGADISEFGGAVEAGDIGAGFHRAIDASGRRAPVGDRRRQRIRPRRRVRAGPRMRLPHRRPAGRVRPARDPARDHPRWRRHAAARPHRRRQPGQGDVSHRSPGACRGGAAHRSRR